MAGGYSHLTLVRQAITLASNAGDAAGPETPTARMAGVLDRWGRYAFLGGVSPDYPYLGLDADWADLMHKGKTNEMIRAAMPAVHVQRARDPSTHEWQRSFAWLLGFVSHVIADVTIHPVVNIKVGRYEDNKDAHRTCEMNQDVWIYKKITGLDLDHSDNMKAEIRACGQLVDLDDGVEDLWAKCLEKAYQQKPGEDQIDWWHASFIKLVDFAENGRKVPVFGRHLVRGAIAYPAMADHQYIDALEVPTSDRVKEWEQPLDRGNPLSFDVIFDKAVGHVMEAWSVLAEDMFQDNLGLHHNSLFGDWSLDTGIDNATGRLRLWPQDRTLV